VLLLVLELWDSITITSTSKRGILFSNAGYGISGLKEQPLRDSVGG